jgi:hypothetical protein
MISELKETNSNLFNSLFTISFYYRPLNLTRPRSLADETYGWAR